MSFDKGDLMYKVVRVRFVKSVKFMVTRSVEGIYLLKGRLSVIVDILRTVFW